MSDLKAEWYVIQVISGTEENVKQSLFQRRESFSLEDHICDVFVPTHDVISTRASWEEVKKKKNILPWYILVQMVVTNESWYILGFWISFLVFAFCVLFYVGQSINFNKNCFMSNVRNQQIHLGDCMIHKHFRLAIIYISLSFHTAKNYHCIDRKLKCN